MSSLKSTDILVRAMRTPNPHAIKFVVNFPLKTQGHATFTSSGECADQPLFSDMFSLQGVEQIYVFENQLTTTHNELPDFENLTDQIESIIKTRGAAHDPNFKTMTEKDKKKDLSRLPAPLREVEEVLDRTIRPGLQADGGDIEVLSFEGNTLKISYQGACGGCPSSYMGTLEAIENILRHELKNEALEVYPV